VRGTLRDRRQSTDGRRVGDSISEIEQEPQSCGQVWAGQALPLRHHRRRGQPAQAAILGLDPDLALVGAALAGGDPPGQPDLVAGPDRAGRLEFELRARFEQRGRAVGLLEQLGAIGGGGDAGVGGAAEDGAAGERGVLVEVGADPRPDTRQLAAAVDGRLALALGDDRQGVFRDDLRERLRSRRRKGWSKVP
jgi:hypothetical protein